jgi:hypothetical protein
MDVELRTALDKRLRNSRIEIQTLMSASPLQNDLQRAIT